MTDFPHSFCLIVGHKCTLDVSLRKLNIYKTAQVLTCSQRQKRGRKHQDNVAGEYHPP